jgi:hypothetical protein
VINLEIATIIWIITNILTLVITAIAVLILRLNRNENYVDTFMRYFLLGTIAYSIGEALFIVFDKVFPSWADVFFTAGSLLIIVSFSVLLHSMEKVKLQIKEIFIFMTSLIFTLAILSYEFYTFILPNIDHDISIGNILNFFYPISSVLIFYFAYFYQINKEKKGFLFYIMSSFFFMFIGDMLFTYTSWTNTYGIIGLVHDISYLLGYLIMLFGVFLYYHKKRYNR